MYITLSDLLQFCLVLIGLAALIFQNANKK